MEIYEEIRGVPEGLTSDEARRLTEEGKVNISTDKTGKSYFKIIKDNVFTYFNLLWLSVAFVLVLCSSFDNLAFLGIIIPNTLISIFQEIRAKRTVEKLSVTTDPRAKVIRDGRLATVKAGEVVLGDVMLVSMGKQVLSDAVVISGAAEANESMLTGESDAIRKETGDTILAGSFLVSGSVYAKVIRVGKDNYVHKLEKAAKSFKAPASNLFRDMNKFIKWIGMLILPIAFFLFLVSLIQQDTGSITEALVKTCGSVTSMIPAGIYLLVTMTLSLSVVKLARKKTLVQDMYSIEMLASADVLCLDKTGTITDGTMEVSEYIILDGTRDEKFRSIMANIEGCEQSMNNTSKAIADYFGIDVSQKKILAQIPFSSSRKYSAISIDGVGAFSIGAPHFVPCEVSDLMEKVIKRYAAKGMRVLLVAKHYDIEMPGAPMALIAISDRIRPGAKETIAKFQEQDVAIKVISGDHAETVSTIAGIVGIKNSDLFISCDGISNEELIKAAEQYTVFGRVTPEQKVLLIKTLKENGHTVAMTGDGVNDTLALKESNCAIAMADGSEVARKVSQIVLMNSDFSSLPSVVAEGRRCINNVRKSACLYIMKTLFTVMLSILTIALSILPFDVGNSYPFEPKQMFMLEFFIIGFASFALAFEPNHRRIVGSFLETVIIRSIPNALAMFVPVLLLMIYEKLPYKEQVLGPNAVLDLETRNAIAVAVITAVGLVNLIMLCRPFNKWRIAVISVATLGVGCMVPISIYLLGDLYKLTPIANNYTVFSIFIIGATVHAFVLQAFRVRIERVIEKRLMKRPLKFKMFSIADALKSRTQRIMAKGKRYRMKRTPDHVVVEALKEERKQKNTKKKEHKPKKTRFHVR